MDRLEFSIMKVLTKSKILLEEDRLPIASRMMQYFRKYKNESFKILAVEKGFSKVLYEDKNVYFVYEGRPDLVVDFGSSYGHGPVDHKSESRRSDIYEFNNQFQGYCWAMGSKLGMINYLGLQKESNEGKKDDVLRRTIFNFSEGQLEAWKNKTIKWYFRVMQSINSNLYLPSGNCEGKYGTCVFHEICEQPSERAKDRIIAKDFIINPKVYTSW